MKSQSEIRQKFLQVKGDVSLRELADKIGTSKETLSRFQRGVGTLDADNLAKICLWLNISMGVAKEVYVTDTLGAIQAAIRDDNTLTEDAQTCLCDLMAVCYRAYAK